MIGGIVTIVVTMAIICIFVVKIKIMFLREGTVIKKNTIVAASNAL
jgi:hypothetical protein